MWAIRAATLIRHGRATALTRDHTVVGERVRLGLISAEEAAEAETRHVLTRSLGNAMFVGVETRDHLVLTGDVLLLCSDGLHGAVPAADIADIVTRNTDLNAAARELIDAANHRDGSDNVSVQLIRDPQRGTRRNVPRTPLQTRVVSSQHAASSRSFSLACISGDSFRPSCAT